MKFDLAMLSAELTQLPPCRSLLVGLSGGLDSVVLLHALVQLRARNRLPWALRAMHVNHGLHPDAAGWEQACRQRCSDWGVEFLAMAVTVAGAADPERASGLENAAREARYRAFAAVQQADEVLLLAHHRDDQMETLLLRLMRGAGPRGLAGIPRQRPLATGSLFRPLLGIDRQALAAYGTAAGLSWIEDSANTLLHFDRNYLRHEILPRLEARWPGYRESWSKTAALAAEAESVLQEVAEADLRRLRGEDAYTLRLTALQELSGPRQRNVLRRWFAELQLPEPGWHLLYGITDELLAGDAGGGASKQGNGITLVRHRDRLVVKETLPPLDTTRRIDWNPVTTPQCELPDNGRLVARASTGSAADRRLEVDVTGPVQIRYRDGGETCHLRDRPRKPLKKVLQEASIEPWWRERLPLLYRDDALLCIPGIGVTTAATSGAADAVAGAGSPCVIEWQRPPRLPPED